MQEYDRTSKWLIGHHGDAILRLAGIRDLVAWRPLQAELVQPRQLPDGLIEATRAGGAEPDLFVLELATYPDARLLEQMLRDMTLVYLDRRRLPEVLVLVLHPKGQLRASEATELRSPLGWTRWGVGWRVVELWTVPAEDLLATGDVGAIPWVPLSRFKGPPEPILRECRERIDRQAPADERENLLAVTQVLTGLRYNDPRLLMILGGEDAMIESPVLQEFEAKVMRREIVRLLEKVLQTRFEAVPPEVATALRGIVDPAKLDELVELALRCPDLDAFRAQLLEA
jgi:hypothetical protein